MGYKKIGSGLVSVFFAGEISAVKPAIDSGVAVVRQPALIKGQLVIARPEKQVVALLTGLKGKELTPPVAEVQQEPVAPVAEVAAQPAEAAAPVVETPVVDNKPARTGGRKEHK